VAGILERDSNVHATVVPTRRKGALQKEIREHVVAGSAIFTDELKSYDMRDSMNSSTRLSLSRSKITSRL